ncbi:MAG: hypothetical protein CVT67_02850 [Actinobacteria bacterium HGW-Actinobacteria-7]|jgi:hypothetical protein|nr:MAG: hypothetical protein CVT67_02850 [Actinobacteria bacterium HGW-Actinobacteria-7]
MQFEQDISPSKMRRPRMVDDELRDYFMRKPFDMTLGAYYPNDIIEKYDLTTAIKVRNFTRGRLERAGYRGYYVIVVHDKMGSTLWHPHMLLDGRNDQFNKVKRSLFTFADVTYASAGPVKDLGSCAGYMAMRACERGYNSDMWEFDFMGEHKKRRPRGSRGHGRGHSETRA